MKKVSTFLMFLLACTFGYSQFGPQQIISTDANGPQSVFTADIDGDTDQDVLSASQFDSTIAWYENTNGMGAFGPKIDIASLDQTRAVHAADLDGDTDFDVMAVSGSLDTVVWYENLDGQGNFGPQQIISTNSDGAFSVVAADIDGDTDMDIIVVSNFDNKIAWFENTDGLGNFGPEQIISQLANNGFSISVKDIDGDTDLDIVASSSGSVIVSWFENLDGQGNYGPPQTISPTGLATVSVFAIDLDGDTDNDVLSASAADDRISWYENLDGLGNFGTEQIITSNADFARSVFAADLDNDDDIDVLSASALDNKIAWYENLDGLGNFSSQQVITTDADSARSVFAADIDGDSDMDVLSASQNDDKIAWYENLYTLSFDDFFKDNLILYPVPVERLVHIVSESKIQEIHVYNELGQQVLVAKSNGVGIQQIDVENLAAGIYFVKLVDESGSFTIHQLVKY